MYEVSVANGLRANESSRMNEWIAVGGWIIFKLKKGWAGDIC